MVQHWKCCVRQRTAGSNPVLSAKTRKSRILCGIFCVFWRRGQRGRGSLWFACRLRRHTPRVSRFAGNGVILSPLKEKVKRKPVPHSMRDFCVLAERTERKGFLVVRVSALPTYAEGPALCVGNGVILSVFKQEHFRNVSAPHFMRDFLCFGGEDRAEGVPCGSRVGEADIRRESGRKKNEA